MEVPRRGSVNISQMLASSMLKLCLSWVNLRFSTRTTSISHHRCNISRAWRGLPVDGMFRSHQQRELSFSKGMLYSRICECAVISRERVSSPALSSQLRVLCNCRRAVDPDQEGTSVCFLIIQPCAVKGRGKKYRFFSMNQLFLHHRPGMSSVFQCVPVQDVPGRFYSVWSQLYVPPPEWNPVASAFSPLVPLRH